MTLMEFTLIPLDKGSSFSKYVARVLAIVDKSGLDYCLTPMGTIVEGEWSDLLALLAVVWLLTASGTRAFLVAGAIALVGDLIAPGRLGLGFGWMLLVGYGVTQVRARFRGATDGRGFMLYEFGCRCLAFGRL